MSPDTRATSAPCWCRSYGRSATRSWGSTAACSRMHARRGPAGADDPQGLRDVEARVDGFEAVIHLAGLSNDPLGDLNPTLTYEINHRPRCASPSWPRTRASSASCSPRPAASTAPPATTSWTRPAPSTRSPPTASPRSARSRTCAGWPTAASARSTCAPRPPMAPRRSCASTSRSTIWSPGRPPRARSTQERRHVLAAVRAHRGHRPGLLVLLRAPDELVHNQAFNIGRTDENYRISEIAELVRDTCRAPRSSSPPTPRPRSTIGSTATGVQILPDYHPRWRVAQGKDEVFHAIRGRQHRGFRGSALQPDRLPAQAPGRRAAGARPALGPAAGRRGGGVEPGPPWTSIAPRPAAARAAARARDDARVRGDAARRPAADRESSRSRGQGAADGRLLPRLHARADHRDGAPGDPVRRPVPVLLVGLEHAARALARQRPRADRAPGAGRRARWWSRSPATTATCCATSSSTASRCWVSSPRRQRRPRK